MKKLFYLFLMISHLGLSQTPITDANFDQAIQTCLSTNPENGLCYDSEYGAMPNWDVSNVTDMSHAFSEREVFNSDIRNWDVGNVTNMSHMFFNTSFNQDIGNWNVSNVTDMTNMLSFDDVADIGLICEEFSNSNYELLLIGWSSLNNLQNNVILGANQSRYCSEESRLARNYLVNTFGWVIYDDGNNCREITQENIGQAIAVCLSTNPVDGLCYDSRYNAMPYWDVSNITDMQELFYNKEQFNADLSNWDVSNVTDMNHMFYLSAFNQDISNWNVSSVTNMRAMFGISPFNQDLSNWDVSNVTDMHSMFFDTPFNQDISNWDVGNVSNMEAMFYNSEFNKSIGNWNVGNVSTLGAMFYNSPFNKSVNNWDVSSVENMSKMFGNSPFNQDISNWNVNSVTDMRQMFQHTPFDQDISNWEVSSVTKMGSMFNNTPFNQNIGNWDVSNVTDMSGMFAQTNFNKDISNWDVSNVTNMNGMFRFSPFNQDISNWNVSSVSDMRHMFGDSPFNQDMSNWDISNVSQMNGIFNNGNLSTANYDALLIGWGNLPVLKPNVTFDITSSYCNGNFARYYLVNFYGWEINDNGYDCSTLGADEINNLKFSIFPNPSRDIINIESDAVNLDIGIFNSISQKILSSKSTNQIDVSSFSNGLYFVKISDGIRTTIKKFIKY